MRLTSALIVLLFSFQSLQAQEQDEVLSTMYRYHPKQIITDLQIDSCFIHEVVGDSLILSQVITYDVDGKELKSLDYSRSYEFVFSYDSLNRPLTSSLVDWDRGQGPVDSTAYDKHGNVSQTSSRYGSYSSGSTKYFYKKGLLIASWTGDIKTEYAYKKGKRMGYKMSGLNGVIRQVDYYYDEKGNLTTLYETAGNGEPHIRFKLDYYDDGLFKKMMSFSRDVFGQQYVTHYDDRKLISKRESWTSIKNEDIDKSVNKKFVYSYSYRK